MGYTKNFYTGGMPILEDPLIPEGQTRYKDGRDIHVYRGSQKTEVMPS